MKVPKGHRLLKLSSILAKRYNYKNMLKYIFNNYVMREEAVAGRSLLQEGDGKADDTDMQGWKLVILLKFVVVELLKILSVKNCIS